MRKIKLWEKEQNLSHSCQVTAVEAKQRGIEKREGRLMQLGSFFLGGDLQ